MAAAVRRGLRTPLLVGDLPFGSYERSNEQAIDNAQRFVREAGCDAVKLERGGASVERARAIVRAGHPGDGTRRADAADRERARRLQGAGPDRRAAPRDRRGRARAAGGGLLRDRLRGGSRRGHRGADGEARGPGDRHRRRRFGPTARCSSSTTCSESHRATCRGSSSAMPRSTSEMVDGVRAYAADVRRAPSRAPSTSLGRAGRAGRVPRYLDQESLCGHGLGLVGDRDLSKVTPPVAG